MLSEENKYRRRRRNDRKQQDSTAVPEIEYEFNTVSYVSLDHTL